jgi:DNA-binding transcriptional regulator YdaS (Cro superfamily)
MTTPTRFEALMQVAECFPTQEAMADAFDVSQPTVWRWLNQSKQLPAEHVLKAEEVTGVPRHHLRPDLYPVDLAPGPRWHGVDQRVDPYQAAVLFNQQRASKRGAAA